MTDVTRIATQVVHILAQIAFWICVANAIGYFLVALLESIMAHGSGEQTEVQEWRNTVKLVSRYMLATIVLGVLLANGVL